MGLNQIQLVEN